MTCIVGIEKDGKVYIGGDSCGSSSWTKQEISNRKVFKRDGLVIGYTDTYRLGQLLQYDLKIPALESDDPMEYLVSKLIPSVRELLKSSGYSKIENSREEGGTFLIGLRGQLFEVLNDFGVVHCADGYDSIGSGYQYALATLKVTGDVMVALETAAYFTPSVEGPFYVVST